MLRIGLLIALLAFVGIAAQAQSSHMVYIDGERMVSLSDFSQDFNAAVGYDVDRGAIAVTLNGQTVFLIPNCGTAWVNDCQVTLCTPVVIIDTVTYVPLDFLCQAFNLGCDWSTDQQQVCVVARPVGVVYPASFVRVSFIVDEGWCRRHPDFRRNDRPYRPQPYHGAAPSHGAYDTAHQEQWQHAGNSNPSYHQNSNSSHPSGGYSGGNYQHPNGNVGQLYHPNPQNLNQASGGSGWNHAHTTSNTTGQHGPQQQFGHVVRTSGQSRANGKEHRTDR